MSLGMMLLLLNLLLEANFKSYYHSLKSNKAFLLLFAVFLLHLIGMLYSENFSEGLNDIRVKLPLLIVPLGIIAKPISDRKTLNFLLGIFVFSLVITSLINFSLYNHWFGNREYDDLRGMSLFGSHIRYGILISLAAAISFYLAFQFRIYRFLYYLISVWFVFYTFNSGIISGFIALFVAFCAIVFFYLYHWKKWSAVVFVLLTAGFVAFTFYLILPAAKKFYPLEELPTHTAAGNPYKHDFNIIGYENGEPVFIMVCEEELHEEWIKVSEMDLNGSDKSGQELKITLIRYMTSKKLPKDREGFRKLSEKDIQNIENGIPTVRYLKPGIFGRLATISHQIENNTNPNGHSLLQRFAFWDASWKIIKKNLWVGVGSGDSNAAFQKQYETDNSRLLEENRLRSHNQFLAIWVSFGVIGLIIFLWMLFHFTKLNFGRNELCAFVFIMVYISSFLIEDTLETQMGVTSFAFFYGLFSLAFPGKSVISKV